MVDNKVYKKTIKDLEEFEQLDAPQRDQIQFDLLKQTVEYAYEHVPYYRESFDKAGYAATR